VIYENKVQRIGYFFHHLDWAVGFTAWHEDDTLCPAHLDISGDPAPSIAPDVPRVEATPLTLRGTPYRNGGSEPSRGFDCSGLVQWVFAQHGTALPRQTTEQFTVGEGVDPSEIRAGDLVFFSTVSRGASHVGIALGDGRFLHAPSSRGVVRVERYEDSAYWSRRFVGARRVAGPPPVVAPSDLAASTQAD
jgi:cell wall-associated NlpC family hydrolase